MSIGLLLGFSSLWGQRTHLPYWEPSSPELRLAPVHSITQDVQGRVWLATAEELFFYQEEMQQLSYFRDSIAKLGTNPHLWVQSTDGKLYYAKQPRLYTFKVPTAIRQIQDFRWDNKDNLWIVADSTGLWKRESGAWRRYKLGQRTRFALSDARTSEQDNKIPIQSLVETPQGIWFNTQEAFYRIQEGQEAVLMPGFEPPGAVKLYYCEGLYAISEGRVWHFQSGAWVELDWLAPVRALYATTETGALLLSTQNALWLVNTQLEPLRALPLISNVQIQTLFIDQEENYWIATKKAGVLVFPFLHVRALEGSRQKSCIDLCSDDQGNIFAAYASGQILHHKGSSVDTISVTEGGERLHQIEWRDSRLWWITDSGIGYWDANNNTKSFFPLASMPNLRGFCFSGKEVLLFSNSRAAFIRWRDLGRKKLRILKNPRSLIYPNWAITDEKGIVWLGTQTGLWIWRPGSQLLEEYELKTPYRLNIQQLQFDDSRLWLATSSGLRQFGSDGRPIIWPAVERLSQVSCYSLRLQSPYLWIGTQEGLYRLHLSTQELEQLQGKAVWNEAQAYTLHSTGDSLWVGTQNGVLMLPESLAIPQSTDALLVKRLQKGGQTVALSNRSRSALPSEKLELPYGEEGLQIAVNSKSHRRGRPKYYEHRLRNAYEDWRQLQNPILYLNPSREGNYVLEIRAHYGAQTRGPILQVPIYIPTPYWKQLWFQLLMGAAAILVLSLLIFWLLRRRWRARQLRSQLQALRMQALQSQMNPHFVFNALNSIQNYIVHNENRQAMHYLNQFAQLIRLVFEYSKRTQISLADELRLLRLYCGIEQARFQYPPSLDIEIEEALDLERLYVPPLLFQPLVENAFKHGLLHKDGEQHLLICFRKIEEDLQVVIEDNGVGRAAAARDVRPQHESSGLSTVRERLFLLLEERERRRAFKIIDLMENGHPSGTRIELRIPLYRLNAAKSNMES